MDPLTIAAIVTAAISAIGTGASVATNISSNKRAAGQQLLQQRYNNMTENEKNSQLFAGNLQSFYNNQDAVEQRKNDLVLPTLNNNQFKCGGSRYYKRPKSLLGTQDNQKDNVNNFLKYFYDREMREQYGLFPKDQIKYLPLKERIREKRKWEEFEYNNKRRIQEEEFYNGNVYNSKLYQKLDNFDNKYLNNMILPTKNMRKGSTKKLNYEKDRLNYMIPIRNSIERMINEQNNK